MKTHARSLAVAIVVLLTLTLLVPLSAGAATHTVTDCGDSGSPGQLRHVIAAASPGDTIAVAGRPSARPEAGLTGRPAPG